MGAATAEKPKAASTNGNGGGEGEQPQGEAGEQTREPLDGEHGDEGAQDAKPKAPPIELEGVGQLSLKIGGKSPDKATAKLVGGKIAIPKGEYQPGEYLEAVVKLRVSKVAINHKVNDGETVEVEREHQFKMVQIEKIKG